MGKMVLVVICTGKCWPCCCFMYLFIPHTGKFVFNCASCALAKRTLAQPHRIPFKPGDFFFASSWSPRNVSIALRTRGGEEGQISETTLKRSRISQLIFECCCCYFFFFWAELYRSPNPESCGEAKKEIQKGWRRMRKAFEVGLNSNCWD